ncbi:MAG: mandelate racemase/muconate lactonizing enzyme family protein [Chloroflexi bacterium]|nr:mandelate racemase/muconate lactonizing enzyme family protein [Chloroflexota bacterium]
MRIVDVTSRVLSLPMARSWGSSAQGTVSSMGHVLVQVRTDSGLEGIGYAFTINGRHIMGIKAVVDELKGLIIGDDPIDTEAIWQKLWAHSRATGPGGLATYAVAAIDTALWDLRGKAAGLPVHRLLGSNRDRVPTYASHDLWRTSGLNELAGAAAALVEQGFKAMKMRVGGESNPEKEVERVRVVREAIGRDIALMLDANQAWSPSQAVITGRKLEPLDIYWLEDPVAAEDIDGCARVAAALDIPIAAGEREFARPGFRRLLEGKAIDIAIVDLQRAGGITEWTKVAAMLGAWNIPVATHVAPEVLCHAFAPLANGLTVEYMPWSFGLLKELPQIENGFLPLPQKPGLGFELDEEALAKHDVR